MAEQVYQPRNPKASPLWRCVDAQFEEFLQVYSERYQPRYGVLRDVIPEVVGKFLECGDLEKGFARVRCPECRHEFLVAFSCKARWFCPSCHQKKVLWRWGTGASTSPARKCTSSRVPAVSSTAHA